MTRVGAVPGSKDVANDSKGTGVGSGIYFPLAASQRWDSRAASIRNGVYLSHLAALEFSGKMVMSKVRARLPGLRALKLRTARFRVALEACAAAAHAHRALV